MEKLPEIVISTRNEWREWLTENHSLSSGVWIVFYKKETGIPTLDYNEFVEEALCFGWIDSIIKNIDEKKYLRKVKPRTNSFKWSPSNRERVERLLKEGKMTKAGMDKIGDYPETGKLLWPDENKMIAPTGFSPHCMELLRQNNVAFTNYMNMPLSSRKRYTLWVMSAKQEKTQLNRMAEAVKLLEINHKNLMK